MKSLLFTLAFFFITIGGSLSQTNPLDLTFGKNGTISSYCGCHSAKSYFEGGMAIQSDGKILIAGTTFDPGNLDFIISRFTKNGLLDSTFGTFGKVYTDFNHFDDVVTSMAIQTDGKILAGGYSLKGPDGDFVLVRYKMDGAIDPNFGVNGKVITPVGAGDDRAYSMAIHPDGRIILAGYTKAGNTLNIALVRYNPDGSLDDTFGMNGKLIIPSGRTAFSVVVQPDDKILVAGNVPGGAGYRFWMSRYYSNGQLDSTFGTDGVTITPVQNSSTAYGMTLQPNGRILVTGSTTQSTLNDFATVRYYDNGTLDHSFGTQGKVVTNLGNIDDTPFGVVVQPNEQILVAGVSGYKFALVKYNPDGTLDATFGTGGIVMTAIQAINQACGMDIQPGGKVIVGGYSYTPDSTYRFSIVRYHSDMTVGVIEFSKDPAILSVYPNPVNIAFTMEYDLARETALTIHLYDMNGRMVQYLAPVRNLQAGHYSEHILLDDQLPAGQYVVCFSDGEKKFNVSVIKQ